MPKILVIRDDGQVEEVFENVPTRGGEWHGLALNLQRAVKRAEEPGAGDGAVLVPMVDFVGPAFTLLARADLMADLLHYQGQGLEGVIRHFNSILDTPVEKWKRNELYKTIQDWKVELLVYLSDMFKKFPSPEEENGNVGADPYPNGSVE